MERNCSCKLKKLATTLPQKLWPNFQIQRPEISQSQLSKTMRAKIAFVCCRSTVFWEKIETQLHWRKTDEMRSSSIKANATEPRAYVPC